MRKRISKKHEPRIIQIIQLSNISHEEKQEAIKYIASVSKSDARRAYCGFKETASTLKDAFNWERTFPGTEFWSNFNNKLITNS